MAETQEANTSRKEARRRRKRSERRFQRCRIGKKGSKNRPISKGEMGNKPERVVSHLARQWNFWQQSCLFYPSSPSFFHILLVDGPAEIGVTRSSFRRRVFFPFLFSPFHLYFEILPHNAIHMEEINPRRIFDRGESRIMVAAGPDSSDRGK